jgi:hypothetical protein
MIGAWKNRAAQVINPLEDLVRQAKAEFPQIQGRNWPVGVVGKAEAASAPKKSISC